MRIFIFFVIGVFLISGINIDFRNGLFLMHGSAKDYQSILSLILITIWTISATMLIPLKKRLLLFLYLSVYFSINHTIFFWMVQNTVENTVPIRESLPLIKIAYHDYKDLFGVGTIILHVLGLIATYLYFIFIMFLILRIKAMYQEGKIYWKKRKW